MEYDYKKVDWKEVRAQWDTLVFGFKLVILHDGHRLLFHAQLDKSKRYRLMLYVDGWYKGAWCNKGHEYYKYHNMKTSRLKKWQREVNEKLARKGKKWKALGIDIEKQVPYTFATPVFDNIAQIKKMVEALD